MVRNLYQSNSQTRNQLGTPGGTKRFLREAQNFYTISNSFRQCPTHFPGVRRKNF